MARPIKPTPILYGKDAIRFEENMKTRKYLSKEEVEEQRKAYELFKSRAVNFTLP